MKILAGEIYKLGGAMLGFDCVLIAALALLRLLDGAALIGIVVGTVCAMAHFTVTALCVARAVRRSDHAPAYLAGTSILRTLGVLGVMILGVWLLGMNLFVAGAVLLFPKFYYYASALFAKWRGRGACEK